MTPQIKESQATLKQLAEYLRFDPTNLALLSRAVDAAMNSQEIVQGLELLDRMLVLIPGSPQILYKKSQLEIAAGRLDDAEEILRGLVDRGNDAPELNAALGHVYFLKGAYDKAKPPLGAAMKHPERAPNLAPVYLRTLHHAGDLAEAIAFGERWLGHSPDDAAVLGVLSLLYEDHGDAEKALQAARRSVSLGGETPEALLVLGSNALAEQRVGEAAEHFTRVLQQNPKSGRAWLGQGLLHMMSLELEAACESLDRCVQHMPDHIGSWHALAWCQILRQDYQGAEESFNRSLQIDDNFGESHGGLGVLAALQGDDTKAKKLIKRATRLDAGGFSGRFAQSVLLDRAGKAEDAKKIIQAIIGSVDPKALAASLARLATRRR